MLTLELVIPLDVRTLVAVTDDAVNALVLNDALCTSPLTLALFITSAP